MAGLLFWGTASVAPAQPVTAPSPNPMRATAVRAITPALTTRTEMAPPAPGQAEPVVIDARIGDHADRTRFVVELSDPVKFHIFTLANPDRLVIDMPEVLWRLKGPPAPTGMGAVRSYRYGLFRPGNSRFVIDLNRPVRMAEPLVLPPQDGYGYRLVLDLFPTTQTAFEKTAGWPADLRAREQAAAELASLPPSATAHAAENTHPRGIARKKVVVIDPGHGGIDSGTVGVTGLEEKNLVLDEGLRLARVLRARGYTVYLTRKTDVFIPLYSRAPFARRHHADLFISLHADSNPDPSVRGASIYTLSERGSDKEAAALARKENQSDIIAGVDLSGDNSSVASILIDLAQRDTMNRSSRFAQTVIRTLSGPTDILPRKPHRSANFVVLRAPDVPAVLIELGYLSNRHDCRQMAKPRWRNAVARAIADSVDRQLAPAVAARPAGNVE
jgi:N-acetylmuramoyl-L-alanine amidase